MSRSTSQSSSATTTTTTGLSRSLSVKTNTKPSSNPLSTSDVKLFVTNLRLLDLDLRNDWPNISVQTFSSKSADQKQRIGGVEWALFRLFEIWDPEETSQKLQPFFPPLEPLQSLNLRAALYRCLNELKKSGILGRESVIRKTMLDECKGEKFFEILALFSTAVLKKFLASGRGNKKRTAVAKDLATAPMLSTEKQQSLIPLAIAHKAALANVLRRKDEKRRRFEDFEALLNEKADDINVRIRKCKDTPRANKAAIPQKEADAIKKQLKDNWIGNQKWLDIMLHGDNVQTDDAFLNSSFNHVWYLVEEGRELEGAASEAGLLGSLQLRVQEHQSRLQKWKSFYEKLHQHETKSISATKGAPATMREFKFDDHLQYQLRPSKQNNADSVSKPTLRSEYQDILSELDDELLRLATAKHNHASGPQLRRRASSLSVSRSPARSRKPRADSIPKVPASPVRPAKPAPPSRKKSKADIPVLPPPRHRTNTATPLDSEATLIGHASTMPRTGAPASRSVQPSTGQYRPEEPAMEETSDPLPIASPSPLPQSTQAPSPSLSPPLPPSSYFPSEPPVLEPPQLTHEEAMAEQIISSIGNATPSPIKQPQPRLSLLERTRMSMARTSSFPPITESPNPDSLPLPSPPSQENDPAPLDRRASLLERTRLSMAAMNANPGRRTSLAATNKDKKSRKSERQSIFPVNQFDTPRNRKSFQAIEEAKSGEHTPKEDLFSDDADYDRVFKSRPRIAQSPVFSPAPGEEGEEEGEKEDDGEDEEEFDEGVTGVDLADVDQDDEDGFTQAWENSPLRAAGNRRGRLFG